MATSPETIICKSCNTAFELERHRGMRWLAAGFGAVVGGVVTESLLGALLTGVAFYGGAAYFDERGARRCPACDAIAWRTAIVEAQPEAREAEGEHAEPAPVPH